MNRLNVPVSMQCKTDKPERHKDGSGHHHPMGVFPIEQQMQHLAIALSRYFPFAFRAARACASLCSNSARLSSSGRSKAFTKCVFKGCNIDKLEPDEKRGLYVRDNFLVCSVPWSMSSLHFTNSQRSKRVNVILPQQ